ncbi:DUF3299 domain-containing protein [Limnoglobus roseus]|uniref:Uncharacterized protein n=1 Tax=Limnoglobus roseus TaxID=2598579 RepID=A0A5C1ANS0_9BACT|nr:DUF3299 domain-containing protein [Limnoglobus roseus]QEL20215.1 hypothetical protein PX52LOC_07304 [Limnoglobus roseus]
MTRLASLFLLAVTAAPSFAGLYYSGEVTNPLPAKWRGFLMDHRMLRALTSPKAVTPIHDGYAAALTELESAAASRMLTADETADRGALLVRFGKAEKAVEVLRPAVRDNPKHFRLAANLGTAWQLAGDLAQAEAALTEAVMLAPPATKAAEEAHLKLVRLRRKEGKNPADAPDVIFAKDANAAVVQQLALWLPGDGRLLWQLAEIAHAAGDVRTAASILDGCVTEFGMKSESLRKKRQQWRAVVEELDKREHVSADRGTLAFRSARPLARTFDESKLPPINPDGPTPLPWAALGETTIGKKFAVNHLKFVDRLDGKPVSLVGFIRPTTADAELEAFLFTEFPVGCWFCELPEPTGIVSVQLAKGEVADAVKTPVKIMGTLKLNRDDPEAYLFSIVDAKVGVAD